jgi:hypothetical protein
MARKCNFIASLVMAAVILSYSGCADDGSVFAPQKLAAKNAARGQQTGSITRPSIADREKWRPDGFFTSLNALRICELISNGDLDQLTTLLETGVELNTPGKFGFTVLHWAYVEDEMEAFELLLKHGADPDRRFTESFRWSSKGPVDASKETPLSHYKVFLKNDSILFTSLWHLQDKYCFAALPYSAKGEHFSRGSETLLHRFLQYRNGYESGLQKLIDSGVDLNARGQFGSTPVDMAFIKSPALCLQLLKAGADPDDIADALEHRLRNLRQGQSVDAYEPLIDWLNANDREIKWTDPRP